jgi:heparosan-N-sulfate-glucuronate 5-epimerase
MPAYFRNWMPHSSAPKDANGVVLQTYKAPLGRQYSPTGISQAALGYYDRWLVDTDPKLKASDKAAFLVQISWLLANQTSDGRWLFTFKWGHMPAPWWSAMTDGLAMSALLRAYSMTGNQACIDAVERARTVFERSQAKSQGVARSVAVGSKTYVVYQEYLRSYGAPNVLNGWIFSLVGLYETATYLHDSRASADVWGPDRGFAAVKALLPYYDTGTWTHYYITAPGTDQHGVWETVSYHDLVIGQLRYLATITGDAYFTRYADRFKGYLDACEAAKQCPPPH